MLRPYPTLPDLVVSQPTRHARERPNSVNSTQLNLTTQLDSTQLVLTEGNHRRGLPPRRQPSSQSRHGFSRMSDRPCDDGAVQCCAQLGQPPCLSDIRLIRIHSSVYCEGVFVAEEVFERVGGRLELVPEAARPPGPPGREVSKAEARATVLAANGIIPEKAGSRVSSTRQDDGVPSLSKIPRA